MVRETLWINLFGLAFVAALSTTAATNEDQAGIVQQPIDPLGILRKPIPDKLVVLTFDDGPASHATVVAPILKELGFGGTIYVCDFDSFQTRKDWYQTYRQMKAMADAGLEIGNHTRGHGGGLGNFLDMEDQLLAHDVPRTTTVCWPIYNVVWDICPDLARKGYTFGRGGHDRPYRPTIDHPFDIPSFSIQDGVSVETFIKQARLATQGRIVVFTFHGVPDMEHPPVSLEPATFRVMMQYLKDNGYKVIALRDLAEYVNPVNAFKLPRTANQFKDANPVIPASEKKPYVAGPGKEIEHFAFPGFPGVHRTRTNLTVTVPYATDVTALKPEVRVSAGATVVPIAGTTVDFTRPVIYTVTGKDGSAKAFVVTVKKKSAGMTNDILAFDVKGATASVISGTGITVVVPTTMDLKALAPTLTLSPFAKVEPASSTTRDFTTPQSYTVTAENGSSRDFRVSIVKSDHPILQRWVGNKPGKWSDPFRWSNNLTPAAIGRPDGIVDLQMAGDAALINDLESEEGFQVNQLDLGKQGKEGIKLSGNSLRFTVDPTTKLQPGIRVHSRYEKDHIANPLQLGGNVTVSMPEGSEITVTGQITGPGSLILNGTEPNPDADYHGDHAAVFRIDNQENHYEGGTIVNAGCQLFLFVTKKGLGTGPLRLNPDGRIRVENVNDIRNPVTSNGGQIEGQGSWKAGINLQGNTRIAGNFRFPELTGPGGLSLIGSRGPWGWTNEGTITFTGPNNYTGPTTVLRGTLHLEKSTSLYNADSKLWTPANVSVAPTATLMLNVGGPDGFRGEEVGQLLTNLTQSVNNNGLQERSFLNLNTTVADETVAVPVAIGDSNGPGGGAFTLKKTGPGSLRLPDRSTYTGRTQFSGGKLIVSSLNSVMDGRPDSSLGAPKTLENGIIDIGGNCTLTYTGPGEITDRIFDLTGEKQTFTLEQAGNGLLRFTSPLDISGHGHSKTLILKGSSAGQGELACNLRNPYDRKEVATLGVTKTGSGTWILSGSNSYSGPTMITGGALVITRSSGLGAGTEVTIADGARLDLPFSGELKVRKLTLGGITQPAGTYSARTHPNRIQGSGIVKTER